MMKLAIQLEGRIDRRAVYELFGRLENISAEQLRLDFREVDEIHGMALPLLAGLLRYLARTSAVRVAGLPRHVGVAMDRMGLGGAVVVENRQPVLTLVPRNAE
jgi:ABC-type transporter Mla MlaB component